MPLGMSAAFMAESLNSPMRRLATCACLTSSLHWGTAAWIVLGLVIASIFAELLVPLSLPVRRVSRAGRVAQSDEDHPMQPCIRLRQMREGVSFSITVLKTAANRSLNGSDVGSV